MSPTASMGSSSSNTASQTHAEKSPWGPTIEPLEQIIGLLSGQIDNYKPTRNETRSFNQLGNTAQRYSSSPFPRMMNQAANVAFNFGAPNGPLMAAYHRLNGRLAPYADGDMIGPEGNPQLKAYLDVIRNDATNQVNPMFAAAGRDFSGANFESLGRGIAAAQAPVLAAQYNQDVGRQFDAANTLYGGANNTLQLRTAASNAGADMSKEALAARNIGPETMLRVESMRRGLPLDNLKALTSILGPIAGLGGTVDSNTISSTDGSSSSFGFGAPTGK